jgi:hypothetical protein
MALAAGDLWWGPINGPCRYIYTRGDGGELLGLVFWDDGELQQVVDTGEPLGVRERGWHFLIGDQPEELHLLDAPPPKSFDDLEAVRAACQAALDLLAGGIE